MVAKALNPMDAYRREQKKKELKKNRTERQKTKQAKLSTLDPDEIQTQITKLERQMLTNPTDGPSRKRKQELEDTLKAVVKKRKEQMEEEQRKQAEAAPSAPKTLRDLEAENRERFQSPENSIYYHPTLNPFGAPPPGQPQRYRVPPPMPMASPPPRPHQHNRQHSQRGPPRFQQRGPRGPPRYDGRNGIPPPPPPPRPAALVPVAPKRPGKRPPLPSGPIPPGIIQVPPRPPLPAGPAPFQPSPPPSGSRYAPSPPPAGRPIDLLPPHAVAGLEQFDSHDDEEYTASPLDTDASDVVAPYPPPEDVAASPSPEQMLHDEEMEEQRAQLRSLVPVTLRVQRKQPARPAAATARTVVSAPGPRPPPLATPPPPRPTAPGPPIAPATVHKPAGSDGSVSKEFDAFMDEVKDLL